MDFLFQDPDLVALNKPAGTPTLPARDAPTSALKLVAQALQLPFKGDADPRVRALHRIDMDTSGLLLFALNRPTQVAISQQFQNNKVRKEYLALVGGEVQDEQGTIDAPLERDPQNPLAMKVAGRKRKGKPALTEWKIEDRFRHYTLLRVFPRTGKTHQIRVHLAHIGHALAVDPLYGRANREGLLLSSVKRGYKQKQWEEERPLIARLTLHAHRVGLLHPGGAELSLEAPLPKDFAATLKMLGKWGR